MLSSLRKLALAYYDGEISRQELVKQRTLLLDRLVQDDATVRLERKGRVAAVPEGEAKDALHVEKEKAPSGEDLPAKKKKFFFLLLAAGAILTGAAGWLLYGLGSSDPSLPDPGIEIAQQPPPPLLSETSQFGRIILPSENNNTEDTVRLAAEIAVGEPEWVAAVDSDYAPAESSDQVAAATAREMPGAESTESAESAERVAVTTQQQPEQLPLELELEEEKEEERFTQQEEKQTAEQEVQAATTAAVQPQPIVIEERVSELNPPLAETPQFMPSITVDDMRKEIGHFLPPVDLPAVSRPLPEEPLPERVPSTAPIAPAAPPPTPAPAERQAPPPPTPVTATAQPSVVVPQAASPPVVVAPTAPPVPPPPPAEQQAPPPPPPVVATPPSSEDRIATNRSPPSLPATPAQTAPAQTAARPEERVIPERGERRFKAEWERVKGEVDVFRERLRKERLSPSDIEFFSGDAAEGVRRSNRLGYSLRGCWGLLANNDLRGAGSCFHDQYQQNNKNYEALRGLVEVEYRVAALGRGE